MSAYLGIPRCDSVNIENALDRQGRLDFARFAWTGPTWSFLEADGYDVEELILKSRHRRRTGPWCRWRF